MKRSRRTSDIALMPNQIEFEVFYNAHYEAISRYVTRRVPTSSHDDLVAAVFVVAWRKYATAASPSLAWLYRIASFEVAHERRRLGRHPQADELNELHLIDSGPLEELFDFSNAFSQLSDSDAELLRLVYWENLSRSEIADVLGVSVNAVNVRCHRALGRLSGALDRLTNVVGAHQSANSSPKENL
jgi:RNA polymerase sigma-70 factor (ECF subfamily)